MVMEANGPAVRSISSARDGAHASQSQPARSAVPRFAGSGGETSSPEVEQGQPMSRRRRASQSSTDASRPRMSVSASHAGVSVMVTFSGSGNSWMASFKGVKPRGGATGRCPLDGAS